MKLYRIKKAKTPEYLVAFQGWRDSPNIYWNKDGAFFKRPETIEQHLYLLASKDIRSLERRTFQTRWTGIGFDRKKLKNYKVVITEVSQTGSQTITAENFLKLNATPGKAGRRHRRNRRKNEENPITISPRRRR